jgi:hypothetical protein
MTQSSEYGEMTQSSEYGEMAQSSECGYFQKKAHSDALVVLVRNELYDEKKHLILTRVEQHTQTLVLVLALALVLHTRCDVPIPLHNDRCDDLRDGHGGVPRMVHPYAHLRA